MEITPVAYYHGALESRFAVPRQSGLADALQGEVVFEPTFRHPAALRGLDGFDRVWLIWGFSANRTTRDSWQPVVRPPRLGGNRSMGVWATRSPFRPNPLGLSCVRLEAVSVSEGLLRVRGADLMDNTPIFDIKPYLPYADAFPEAASGFADGAPEPLLTVQFPPGNLGLGEEDVRALRQVLALDPRPAFQHVPGDRIYGFPYRGKELRFRVTGDQLIVLDDD